MKRAGSSYHLTNKLLNTNASQHRRTIQVCNIWHKKRKQKGFNQYSLGTNRGIKYECGAAARHKLLEILLGLFIF